MYSAKYPSKAADTLSADTPSDSLQTGQILSTPFPSSSDQTSVGCLESITTQQNQHSPPTARSQLGLRSSQFSSCSVVKLAPRITYSSAEDKVVAQDLQDGTRPPRPIVPTLPYSPLASPKSTPLHQPSKVKREPTKESRRVSVAENEEGGLQLNQYQVRQEIGKGSYGLVKLAYNESDASFYAMKILSKARLRKSFGLRRPPLRSSARSASLTGGNATNDKRVPSPLSSPHRPPLSPVEGACRDPLHRVYQEITIQKKLDHPNIVRLVEVLDDPQQDNLYMVFEYVENGQVMEVGQDPPLSESLAWRYMRDIVLGLEYLHFQKIVHRDIKPANLLLTSDSHIKITDFGVSNEFVGDDVELNDTAGSPAFMAPESVMEGGGHFSGKALDIWALGVTLYCFLFGRLPFEHVNRFALYTAIVEEPVIFPTEPQVSDDVMDLLHRMLEKDPIKRITISQIKAHPWMTRHGEAPMASEGENCSDGVIEVSEEEVRHCVRTIPRLETLISMKMILKKRSFRNPLALIRPSSSTSSTTKLESGSPTPSPDYRDVE